MHKGVGQNKDGKKMKIVCGKAVGGETHAVSKFRNAISMKILIKNSKRCNIAVECKRLKTVSRGESIGGKSFYSTLLSSSVCVKSPEM